MKVVQETKTFQPVTITIETQNELNILLAALNNSPSNLESLWNNMEFPEKLQTSMAYDMFHQIFALYQLKGETK